MTFSDSQKRQYGADVRAAHVTGTPAVRCSVCLHPNPQHVPTPEGYRCASCNCKRRFLR